MKKPRLFYLDLIRAVALISILIIHFNASVTGYFTLPHQLFTSTLPFGIYLGDFGSTLFFIVSGASLCYTAPEHFETVSFYKKRFRAVYPMFWLAWVICFSIRFVARPGYYAGARTITLILTVLGLDNFAVAAGWVGQDFACVGEWFLGSILFLYLLFPILLYGYRKHPWLTFAVTCAVGSSIHLAGWDARLVAIHFPEFFFGMLVVGLARRRQILLAAAAAVLLALQTLLGAWDTKIVCALFGAVVFVVLVIAADAIAFGPVKRLCALLGKYSYAVFLVHHVIILRLVEGFDLGALSRRDTALLFGAYLVFTALASATLYWLDGKVRHGFSSLLHG